MDWCYALSLYVKRVGEYSKLSAHGGCDTYNYMDSLEKASFDSKGIIQKPIPIVTRVNRFSLEVCVQLVRFVDVSTEVSSFTNVPGKVNHLYLTPTPF